jgi:hypothetical protein
MPPVLSELDPARHLGSISDKFATLIEAYIAANPSRLLNTKTQRGKANLDVDQFLQLMQLRSGLLSQFRLPFPLIDSVSLSAAKRRSETVSALWAAGTVCLVGTFVSASHSSAQDTTQLFVQLSS